MPSIALNELRRSKNALKPIFLSSLLISMMIFSAAHVLSLLLGNLKVYQDDISSMVYNYSIIVDTISFTIFFTIVAIIMGLFVSCIFSIQYIERRRNDISVLKSTGASQNHIKTFFMIPLLVHVTLGTVIAAIASFITLNLALPITGNLGPVYYMVVIGFSIGNVGVVAGTIYMKILWLTKRTVTNLLGKSYNRDYLKARKKTPFTRIFGKTRRYLLLAYKNLKTRKHGFSRIFMILSLICTIVGTVFTASFVIGGTYKSFLRNGMGGDKYQATVIIGHEDITTGIMDAYKSFYIPSVNPSFPNATNNSIYEMNTTLFNQSLVEFETLQLDWRIVDYCEIEEEQGYIIDGSTGQYETIGDHRKASAIVFGVNPSTVFNEWDDGNTINLIDNTTLIVGDSIAGLMIDNIAYQKVKIMNESYNIGARVFDSIANGFSVYMHASELRESLELNPEFFNCGFGQLTTIDQALLQYQVDLLDDHAKSIYGTNFTVKLIGP
ncbi:hypothetical protein GF325_09235, partial [Candidatus Bathyarchaeota archaeon]|nr:hypothetical protein [Candidatus Bathyarchaeota archaeon]